MVMRVTDAGRCATKKGHAAGAIRVVEKIVEKCRHGGQEEGDASMPASRDPVWPAAPVSYVPGPVHDRPRTTYQNISPMDPAGRPGPSTQGQPKFSTVASVGERMRSISSQVLYPTSPIHSSLVPGRSVARKGLRRP